MISPAQLLRRGANETPNEPASAPDPASDTAPKGDLHPISRLVGV